MASGANTSPGSRNTRITRSGSPSSPSSPARYSCSPVRAMGTLVQTIPPLGFFVMWSDRAVP